MNYSISINCALLITRTSDEIAWGPRSGLQSISGLSGVSKHDSSFIPPYFPNLQSWQCVGFPTCVGNLHPGKKNDTIKRTGSHYFFQTLPDPAHAPCNLEKNRRILIERKSLFCSITDCPVRPSGGTLLSGTSLCCRFFVNATAWRK